MRYIYAFIITLFIGNLGFGQTTIAVQDFDGSTPTWNYTSNPTPYSVSGDDWDIVTTNSDPTGTTGSFWGIQDLENPNGGGAFEHTLTFDAINITSYNSVEISFDYYTFGFDPTDEIRYEVFYGPVGSEVGQGIVSLNKDTQAWTTITVAIPDTADSAYLVLGAQQNGGGDFAGFDNITIEGIEIVSSNDTDSEIYDSGSQPAGATLSSLADTSAEAIDVFEFTIEDIGTSDGLSTLVTNVRLFPHTTNTADWTETIQGITLNDGSLIPIENLNITDSFIDATIISGNLDVADGTSSTVTVGVYLNPTGLTDGSIISFMVDADNHGFTADIAGSGFATSFLLGDFNSNDFVVGVEATQLSYVQQPSNTFINTIMSPSVEVAYTDANGNIDIDYSGSGFDISLTTSGSFDATATTTVEAANGLAVFSNLIFDSTASGLILTAVDDTTLISGSFDSTTFDISLEPVTPLAGDLIITEVSDASNFNNEFIEIYNTTVNIIDMSTSKLVMQSDGTGTVWDFNDDIANALIPANGFLIVTRGATQTAFESEFGTLNSNTVFVQGLDAMFFGTGTARSWLIYEGGTVSTADGTLLADTIDTVGGNDRDFFDFATDAYISTSETLANPGVIDNLVYSSGAWKYNAQADENTGESNIIITDNFIATSNINASQVTVDAGTSLTINSGVTLDIANGTTLESTSAFYASLIVNGTLTGNITYNRYTAQVAPTGTNDLIASPFSDQTFGAFATANDGVLAASATLRAFAPFNNNSNAYDNYDTSSNDQTVITSGQGYRAGTINGETLAFEGTLRNSNLSVPLTVGSSSFWNLIGNPYSSYMDTAAFLAANSDNLRPSYVAIYGYNGDNSNGQNSRWTILDSNTAPNPLITPGQGFFVAAPDGGGTSAEFTLAMRTTGSSDDFIAERNTTSDANFAHAILNLNTASTTYVTNLYFRDINTLGLDPGYDTGAFDQTANGIYSHLVAANTGVALANQSLPFTSLSDQSIPLVVNANAGEQLTFSLNTDSNIPSNINVYLEDQLSGNVTLLNTNAYTLTPMGNLSGPGRFYVVFSDNALGVNEDSLNNVNIYALERELFIKGQLAHNTNATLFDMQGRAVLTVSLDTESQINTIDISGLSNGIYIVQLSNIEYSKSKKVILK